MKEGKALTLVPPPPPIHGQLFLSRAHHEGQVLVVKHYLLSGRRPEFYGGHYPAQREWILMRSDTIPPHEWNQENTPYQLHTRFVLRMCT